jgi:hypothetical protein
MHWEWKNCPFAWQCQYNCHAEESIVILEAVASHDLWIFRSFFGMAGSHNETNVFHCSLVFEQLLQGTAHVVNYEINGNAYGKPFYIVDGVSPD